MSKYLRDSFITSVSLNANRIRTIASAFGDIAAAENANLPPGDPQNISVRYMIRFDNKGFLLDDIDDVLANYSNAKKVERINFVLDSQLFRESNRTAGKAIELFLDSENSGNCTLTVQDDDSQWTEATFCRLSEDLRRIRNLNFLVRSGWTGFLVQIIGVVAGTLLSLWTAARIEPMLEVDYAFLVAFILAFLVFSNIWSYLNHQILLFLDRLFPNISFKTDRGVLWIAQTFLAAILVWLAAYLVNQLFQFFGRVLSDILK